MKQIESNLAVCPYCQSSVPYQPTHQEDLQPGTRLGEDGRFIIGRALGHGGYGITYIAYDTKMDVRRTIKEYFPKGAARNRQLVPVYPESEAANVERTRAHFLHEARMMIRASEGHIPGIVQGIDKFDENGTSYILMEYLEGYTLDDYMHNVLYGPFQWDQAVRYAAEALDALQKLHEKNIIHRDISCNNIFLCTDNTIRLIDFGSSEPLDKAQTDPGSLWRSRKPAYTPREQAENRTQGTYSDVYAMAVALFKMITGNVDRQLNGRTLPSVRAAANNQEIPAALDRILMEATAEDPQQRIQTAGEFRRRLLPLIGEKDTSGRRKVLIGVLAFLVSLIVLAVVLIVTSGNQTEDSWAAIKLSDENRAYKVDYGNVYTIAGEAQPKESVQLNIRSIGAEENLDTVTAIADENGQWRIEFDTSRLAVGNNKTEVFETFVEYADPDHHRQSDYVNLTVSRAFSQLTIAFAETGGNNVSVSHGEKVQLSGRGQDGQDILISVENLGEATVQSQNGIWTYELDTAKASFETGTVSKVYSISASYKGYAGETNGDADQKLTLTVNRILAPITIQFDGESSNTLTMTDSDASVIIRGTAEPLEKLTIRIGTTQVTQSEADEYGEWLVIYSSMREISGFQSNRRIEFEVYAEYSAKPTVASDHLTLISDMQNTAAAYTPSISSSRTVRVNEGDTIVLEGTGFPGSTLTLVVTKEGSEDNLVSGKTVQVSEDKTWRLELQTGEIQDDRQEDQWASYTALLTLRQNKRDYSSDSVQIRILKPKSYSVPTIAFASNDSKQMTLRYTEAVELTGTARANEHMILVVDGKDQSGSIVTDGDGIWRMNLGGLETWKPEINGNTEVSLRVRYEDTGTEIVSEELLLNVTNPRLTPIQLSWKEGEIGQSGTGMLKIGGQGTATMLVSGFSGEDVEIYRDSQFWRRISLDENGKTEISVTASDLQSDSSKFDARYREQTETVSNTVQLSVDRIAEQIRIAGSPNEETTSISGTAEAGAVLVMSINEAETAHLTASVDGSFTFEGLNLSAGDVIRITETDDFGNSTIWEREVLAVQLDNIQIDNYPIGYQFNYGPGSADLTLTGRASANRRLRITVSGDNAENTVDELIPVDGNGTWSVSLKLPIRDKLGQMIQIQYEDGRMNVLTFSTLCDAAVTSPEIIETVYVHTPETLVVTIGEPNCTLQWTLYSASGSIREQSSAIEVPGIQTMLTLPKSREANDRLEVSVTDPYGNQAATILVVQDQRDQVLGVIHSVSDGNDQAVRDGSTITDSGLYVRAYVAAGKDAVLDTPVIRLVQNGEILSGAIGLPQAAGEDATRVEQMASGAGMDQTDRAWLLWSGSQLSTNGLTGGKCSLQLAAGNQILASWTLTFEEASANSGNGMHIEDPYIGFDIGVDPPTLSFSTKAVFLSGWLYNLYEEEEGGTARSIGTPELTLYGDARLTREVATAKARLVKTLKRLPGTTQCGADAKNLDAAACKKAGWYVQFDQKQLSKVEPGWYYAILYAAEETLGPFEIEIAGNDADVKKQTDFTKTLTWITEDGKK